MEMEFIRTQGAPAAIGPYEQAVRLGDLIFASGQIPLSPDGVMREGDAAEQARQVFDNLRAVLAAAGSSLQRVVKATVFLADLEDFSSVNAVYAEAFGDHRPARSTVQVARLPRDARVEIEVIASA